MLEFFIYITTAALTRLTRVPAVALIPGCIIAYLADNPILAAAGVAGSLLASTFRDEPFTSLLPFCLAYLAMVYISCDTDRSLLSGFIVSGLALGVSLLRRDSSPGETPPETAPDKST